jgi:multidrug resistance protein, MATE family
MLRTFLPTAEDTRALFKLAVPIVAVQVGLMFMGVVDTIVVGRVSARDLAAAALGNLYFFGIAALGIGCLMSVDPIVSQAVGARDDRGIARGVQRGVVLAILISVPAALLCVPAEAILHALRQPADVVPLAAQFVWISIPGVLPFLMVVVLRQSLQAMRQVGAILVTIVAANLLNAALNWVFVFGNLGAPAMGAAGSSLATTIGRWFMLIMLLSLTWGRLRHVLLPVDREALRAAPLWRTLEIGAPIGVQVALEFGAFAVIALLAGWFGTESVAGHQVAINLASLTFMVPLGVSGAASVMVGNAVGEGDALRARRLASASLVIGTLFMGACAIMMLAIPELLARLYTSVPGVVAVAAALIPIAGVFQVFDGLQVVASGILRGIGDTRAPMVVNMVGFWLMGMPVSLWLGFRQDGGVVGLWWGFVAGLAGVAAFLLWRVRGRLTGALERVRIDDEPALEVETVTSP